MILYHDSRNPIYRNPFGAVCCGTKVTIRIHAVNVRHIWIRTWWNGEADIIPMKPVSQDLYACEIEMPDTPGLFWYYFRAEDQEGGRWFFGNAYDKLGGVGETTLYEPPSYQITVYDRAYKTPAWMRDGVMMQIMVDRFHRGEGRKYDPNDLPPGSYYHIRWDEDPVLVINNKDGEYVANDFFGGDLRGVEEKLDYIASMGVTVLYFNPIFEARSNHKYNTADYRKIDPCFGTEDDFRALCDAAKKKGIRVILDGVFSHTGSDSVYFNRNGLYGDGGAYRDPDSPYRAWYNFEHWPDRYSCWWGFKTLPNVNECEPGYKSFIVDDEDSVVAHWMRAGASGWRLDVADELPMEFIRSLRAREKEIDPESALIGEVWEDPSNKVTYGEMRSYCLGDTLDSTMNYPLREAVLAFFTGRLDAGGVMRRIENMRENLPLPFLYSEMNLLSSHDKPRALAILADVGDMEPDTAKRRAFELSPEAYQRGRRRLIAAWNLICALPGMPCIYYGDEAGMYGMSDPFCRGTYPWGEEDTMLMKAFREGARRRHREKVLRTGKLSMHAIGSDVLLVERCFEHGRDAFGAPAEDANVTLVVNRAIESRWIDRNGRAMEIPAETAIWLEEQRPDRRSKGESGD